MPTIPPGRRCAPGCGPKPIPRSWKASWPAYSRLTRPTPYSLPKRAQAKLASSSFGCAATRRAGRPSRRPMWKAFGSSPAIAAAAWRRNCSPRRRNGRKPRASNGWDPTLCSATPKVTAGIAPPASRKPSGWWGSGRRGNNPATMVCPTVRWNGGWTMQRSLIMLFALIAYTIFFVTFLYLIAFVGNFAGLVPWTVDTGPAATPAMALVVDVGLIALFGVQHSVMARKGFKAWLTRIVPGPAQRSFYVLLASAVLIVL